MRPIIIGMTVNYVQAPASGKAGDKPGQTVKAQVTDVLGSHAALVDYSKDRDGTALAHAGYSQNGEANSFHFTDEADDVKKNQKAASQQSNGAGVPA